MDRLQPWRGHLLFLRQVHQIKLTKGKKNILFFFDATLVSVGQYCLSLVWKTSGSRSSEYMKHFTKNTIRQMKYHLLLKKENQQSKTVRKTCCHSFPWNEKTIFCFFFSFTRSTLQCLYVHTTLVNHPFLTWVYQTTLRYSSSRLWFYNLSDSSHAGLFSLEGCEQRAKHAFYFLFL